jgi:hypothetical protein
VLETILTEIIAGSGAAKTFAPHPSQKKIKKARRCSLRRAWGEGRHSDCCDSNIVALGIQ